MTMCQTNIVRHGPDALLTSHAELVKALEASQKAIRETRVNGAPCAFWNDIEAANLAALAAAREATK